MNILYNAFALFNSFAETGWRQTSNWIFSEQWNWFFGSTDFICVRLTTNVCGESLWLFGVIFKGVRVHVDIYKPTTNTQYVILLVIIRKQFFVILKSYTGPLLCVIILGFFCVVKVITSFKIYGVVWYHNSQHFLFF